MTYSVIDKKSPRLAKKSFEKRKKNLYASFSVGHGCGTASVPSVTFPAAGDSGTQPAGALIKESNEY